MPYSRFKLCPACGKELLHEGRKIHCPSCGFIYFFNPIAAVPFLGTNPNGEVLLVRRNENPGKGMWELPGGFIEFNETAEDAIRREIKEELDLDLGELTYVGTFPNIYTFEHIDYQVLDIVFTAQLPDEGVSPANSELQEAQFFAESDIPWNELAFESNKRALQAYFHIKP